MPLLFRGSANKVSQKMLEALYKFKDVKNRAIGFDVDETLLFWNENNDVTINNNLKPIFDIGKRLGYKIFIITARPHTINGLKYMVNQLSGLGYDISIVPEGGMYMKPIEYQNDPHPGMFKLDARRHISYKYDVKFIAMFGDQWSDIFSNGTKPSSLRNFSGKEAYIYSTPDLVTALGVKLPEY